MYRYLSRMLDLERASSRSVMKAKLLWDQGAL
jgi:hypothetical protein